MPKPHFPARGGAHPITSYKGATSGLAQTPSELANSGNTPAHSREMEAEIQRLRKELVRLHREKRDSATPSSASMHMVWMTLALCGAGLLFALIAILRHG